MSGHKREVTADLLCLVVAAIWGSGFIASQIAIDANMSASAIMALRFVIAAVVMAALCLKSFKSIRPADLKSGAIAGVFLFAAFFTQILGQERTTVSNCAFLTATNVVMVPFIVWIMTKSRPPVKTFALTGVTLLGVGILTLRPGSVQTGLNTGDLLSLLCAVFFALHISFLGLAMKDSDARIINFIQISVAAVISVAVLLAFDFGALAVADFGAGLPAALYLGVFSTCICYFLQTYAQKYTSASKAGVFLSTEGLFGSLFSVVLGMESLTLPMVIGGAVILCSVILMEVLPSRREKRA